jgi:elongator complex protein 3
MGLIPEYTRLQRVQRDIPADFIDAGVWKSNLRQLAERRAAQKGTEPRDVRAREVGMNDADPDPDRIELGVREYEAAGGREQFLAFEEPEQDLLIGFCRLRYPSYSPYGDRPEADPVRDELRDAAVVRELHVYGSEAGIGDRGDWQHRGYGRRLLREAETRAADAGFSKLAVLSGIGVRQYYREKLGYHQDGPYVSKRL